MYLIHIDNKSIKDLPEAKLDSEGVSVDSSSSDISGGARFTKSSKILQKYNFGILYCFHSTCLKIPVCSVETLYHSQSCTVDDYMNT